MTMETIAQGSIEQEFIVRPPTMADLKTAVKLYNLGSQALDNKDAWNEERIRSEWETPGFVLERDCVMLFTREREEIIGYAEVWDTIEPRVRAHGWLELHPDYREQRLAQYLLDFIHKRASQMLPAAPEGARVVIQSGADSRQTWMLDLFQANDFSFIRHFWRMVVDLDAPPASAKMPNGITIRSMLPDEFEEAVRVQVTSFEDHWGYIERPFEEELKYWRHYVSSMTDFDPSLWFVALEDEKIVGVSFCKPKLVSDPEMGWVEDLGVLREARRRGIAEALLRHSIFELHKRGSKRVGLGVDATSLTGATRLYDKVGMKPTRQYDTYELELRAGFDLSTQSVD